MAQVISLATTSLGGPVLQMVKGCDGQSVFRPCVTQMKANLFQKSTATTETFPAAAVWVLQSLKQLVSTDRAIDHAMEGVSKAAVQAALRVTTKAKDSQNPKNRRRSISLSNLSLSPRFNSQSPSRRGSRSPLRNGSRSRTRYNSDRSPSHDPSSDLNRPRSPSSDGSPMRGSFPNRPRSPSSDGSPMFGSFPNRPRTPSPDGSPMRDDYASP
jgi:hypothetical protein